MLRPAASPWRNISRTSAAAIRRTPFAARCINISATSSSNEPALQQAVSVEGTATPMHTPDARFEVIGTPFSLLSVSLSASQTLYTRRGTLVGLSGKSENTLSTLSFLEPLQRAPVGIPFLYQKVSSTSPVTALVSTKAPISSIVSVNMDGRDDWIVSQRNALLAWTGHTLKLKPQYNVKLGLAHWGNTYITGRGLLALAGSGQIYQVQVKAGESYVAHPSNVVAYTASNTPPIPFRFKSSNLRFQVPDLGFGSMVQNTKFFRTMSKTGTWRALATTYYTLKTWLRRTVWGDRLFLRFEGPTTMLIQSRASRISDVLTLRNVDEIADSPPGAVEDAATRKIKEEIKSIGEGTKAPIPNTDASGTIRYATVKDGKAEFEKPKVEEVKTQPNHSSNDHVLAKDEDAPNMTEVEAKIAISNTETAVPYTVFTKAERRMITWLIGCSMFFSPFTANIYFPCLEELQRAVGVNASLINLTITTYLIVQVIAPAFCGDLADNLGRRPVYLITFAIYVCANLGLALQQNYAALMVLRGVQSFGCSATVAIGYGVIADVATPATRGSMLGPAMIATNLGPILSISAVYYAAYYCIQASIPAIFTEIYGLDELQVGLCYFSIGTGVILGGYINGKLMDYNYRSIAKANNITVDKVAGDDLAKFPIEKARSRLSWLLIPTSTAVIVGYGWVLREEITHNTLIVDISPQNTSTAAAAGNITRCALSAAAVAAMQPLLEVMGKGWFFTALAAISGILSAIATIFIRLRGMAWRNERQAREQDGCTQEITHKIEGK
ncbi:uncharacterized protein J4E92_010899 [Alternaria infectoria]|uniref:uncharacterized protein n=1 Tax=Alternaria infectoria TaxID=45303 RepID=UPI0022202E7A|nr:uncharacterized protein J4E92_010899 [Alternaria infectoria]KAI4908447.1 hypothetical protein J4E92_010899 [Alternaria infectoria]